MPLAQEDLEALTVLVTHTVGAVLQQQAAANINVTTGHHQHREKVEERFFRKLTAFDGMNWKDWSFQFLSATRGSSETAHRLLQWAEHQAVEIADFDQFDAEDEDVDRLSGELFNILTSTLGGEPLQLLHNCDFNGAEA